MTSGVRPAHQLGGSIFVTTGGAVVTAGLSGSGEASAVRTYTMISKSNKLLRIFVATAKGNRLGKLFSRIADSLHQQGGQQ